MIEHMEQLPFDFEDGLVATDTATWTPREIFHRLNQRYLRHFREDRRIEWKNHVIPNMADLATYLSAFANTPDGGILVYGVDDNGAITGVKFGLDQVNKIEQCHRSHCPGAKPEFKRIPVVADGRQSFCLAIYVPYAGRLVETNRDEAWIRYGDGKHKMGEEERADFRSTRGELGFELAIPADAKFPDDFDPKIIQDYCDQFRESESRPDWSNEEVLRDRSLLRLTGGSWKPTNALLLFAGKKPRLTIPGCRVRVQRFAGTEEGQGSTYSPLKDEYVEGNLVQIISEAQRVISSIIYDVTWLDESGRFVTAPEYPTHAWQEALINACVHRAYNFSGSEVAVKIFSDRMEIESPGGFVFPVTEKSIYEVRAARNAHLMDALRVVGYVKMAREGTRRIRQAMSDYRLPAPTFKQESVHGVVVKVTLKNANRERSSDKDVAEYFGVDIWRSLSEAEIAIASSVHRNGTIQVSEVQRMFGGTWKTNKNRLESLVTKGVLVFQPGGFIRSPKALYKLAPR